MHFMALANTMTDSLPKERFCCLNRAHCQISIKQGRGWDASLNGRMPDAETSHSGKKAPEGAITGESPALCSGRATQRQVSV